MAWVLAVSCLGGALFAFGIVIILKNALLRSKQREITYLKSQLEQQKLYSNLISKHI